MDSFSIQSLDPQLRIDFNTPKISIIQYIIRTWKDWDSHFPGIKKLISIIQNIAKNLSFSDTIYFIPPLNNRLSNWDVFFVKFREKRVPVGVINIVNQSNQTNLNDSTREQLKEKNEGILILTPTKLQFRFSDDFFARSNWEISLELSWNSNPQTIAEASFPQNHWLLAFSDEYLYLSNQFSILQIDWITGNKVKEFKFNDIFESTSSSPIQNEKNIFILQMEYFENHLFLLLNDLRLYILDLEILTWNSNHFSSRKRNQLFLFNLINSNEKIYYFHLDKDSKIIYYKSKSNLKKYKLSDYALPKVSIDALHNSFEAIIQTTQSSELEQFYEQKLHCNSDYVAYLSEGKITIFNKKNLKPISQSQFDGIFSFAWHSNNEIILSNWSPSGGILSIYNCLNWNEVKSISNLDGISKLSSYSDGKLFCFEQSINVETNNLKNNSNILINHLNSLFLASTQNEIKKLRYKNINLLENNLPDRYSLYFTLMSINQIKPKDQLLFYISKNDYKNALNISNKFGLNSDIIYKKQWNEIPNIEIPNDKIKVVNLSNTRLLSKIQDYNWVITESMCSIGDSTSTSIELYKIGLQSTKEMIQLLKLSQKENDEKHLKILISNLKKSKVLFQNWIKKLELFSKIQTFSLKELYLLLRINSESFTMLQAIQGNFKVISILLKNNLISKKELFNIIKSLPIEFDSNNFTSLVSILINGSNNEEKSTKIEIIELIQNYYNELKLKKHYSKADLIENILFENNLYLQTSNLDLNDKSKINELITKIFNHLDEPSKFKDIFISIFNPFNNTLNLDNWLQIFQMCFLRLIEITKDMNKLSTQGKNLNNTLIWKSLIQAIKSICNSIPLNITFEKIFIKIIFEYETFIFSQTELLVKLFEYSEVALTSNERKNIALGRTLYQYGLDFPFYLLNEKPSNLESLIRYSFRDNSLKIDNIQTYNIKGYEQDHSIMSSFFNYEFLCEFFIRIALISGVSSEILIFIENTFPKELIESIIKFINDEISVLNGNQEMRIETNSIFNIKTYFNIDQKNLKKSIIFENDIEIIDFSKDLNESLNFEKEEITLLFLDCLKENNISLSISILKAYSNKNFIIELNREDFDEIINGIKNNSSSLKLIIEIALIYFSISILLNSCESFNFEDTNDIIDKAKKIQNSDFINEIKYFSKIRDNITSKDKFENVLKEKIPNLNVEKFLKDTNYQVNISKQYASEGKQGGYFFFHLFEFCFINSKICSSENLLFEFINENVRKRDLLSLNSFINYLKNSKEWNNYEIILKNVSDSLMNQFPYSSLNTIEYYLKFLNNIWPSNELIDKLTILSLIRELGEDEFNLIGIDYNYAFNIDNHEKLEKISSLLKKSSASIFNSLVHILPISKNILELSESLSLIISNRDEIIDYYSILNESLINLNWNETTEIIFQNILNNNSLNFEKKFELLSKLFQINNGNIELKIKLRKELYRFYVTHLIASNDLTIPFENLWNDLLFNDETCIESLILDILLSKGSILQIKEGLNLLHQSFQIIYNGEKSNKYSREYILSSINLNSIFLSMIESILVIIGNTKSTFVEYFSIELSNLDIPIQITCPWPPTDDKAAYYLKIIWDTIKEWNNKEVQNGIFGTLQSFVSNDINSSRGRMIVLKILSSSTYNDENPGLKSNRIKLHQMKTKEKLENLKLQDQFENLFKYTPSNHDWNITFNSFIDYLKNNSQNKSNNNSKILNSEEDTFNWMEIISLLLLEWSEEFFLNSLEANLKYFLNLIIDNENHFIHYVQIHSNLLNDEDFKLYASKFEKTNLLLSCTIQMLSNSKKLKDLSIDTIQNTKNVKRFLRESKNNYYYGNLLKICCLKGYSIEIVSNAEISKQVLQGRISMSPKIEFEFISSICDEARINQNMILIAFACEFISKQVFNIPRSNNSFHHTIRMLNHYIIESIKTGFNISDETKEFIASLINY